MEGGRVNEDGQVSGVGLEFASDAMDESPGVSSHPRGLEKHG